MQFRSIKLYKEESLDFENLLRSLSAFGYIRQHKIEEEGDFALRGGVLDIFPSTFEYPVRIDFMDSRINSISSFEISSGKPLFAHTVVIILPKKKNEIKKNVYFSEEETLENFIDLNTGDFVVHNQYGVGLFRGIEKIERAGKECEHMVIEYAEGDKLYVPEDFMHFVQKYVGFEKKPPRIYRLHSKEWQGIKNQAKKGIQKTAFELLRIQAARNTLCGFKFSPDTDWQKEFEEDFPYVETPDQTKSMQEVRRDMESAHPMDRLLCGDVGYGKTEVAMRAAFKAVMDNKQVAFLVPTTILAEQHYQNLTARLTNFPVNVEMLSRFKTKSQQDEIIRRLKDGSVDIVIGTHRLLSEDIVFKDLGLLIIDEEQRFGVGHKEKLKSIRLTVDVLTLTATPIPRTLYLSLMQARDISMINTPPKDRIAVKTQVVEFDEALVAQAIENELRRRGQVYFVHNRILDIDDVFKKIARLAPEGARIMIAHGAMPAEMLETVILRFLKGEIDILVCTMIIGSGIDVANANTLIVNEAENFGLADLHQLRGRVGRFKRQAYAFFLVCRRFLLNKEAAMRLEAILRLSELGSGFKIAFEDLMIRGAGNLLGVEQSGYINSIGFDLYCRLLREVISEFKVKGVR